MARSASVSEIEATRVHLGMTRYEVWRGYFAVGGNGSADEVETWLRTAAEVPPLDYDMLAQAVNDESVERGLDHPVRYSDAL